MSNQLYLRKAAFVTPASFYLTTAGLHYVDGDTCYFRAGEPGLYPHHPSFFNSVAHARAAARNKTIWSLTTRDLTK